MTGTRRDTMASFFALTIVDLAIAWGGFRRLHRLVRGMRVHHRASSADEHAVIAAVNDAVSRAAIWYPRPAYCMPRSVVTTWLLRRRGVAAELVIGVRKMPFYAHAWVEVGGRVVNDVPRVQTLYPAIDRWTPFEARR